MPEGHTIHRYARQQAKLLAGRNQQAPQTGSSSQLATSFASMTELGPKRATVGLSGRSQASPTTIVVDDERLHQLEVLQPGHPGAPIVLMLAGWNGRFLYDGLASLLPANIGVGLLIAYPYPGAAESPVLDAVEEGTAGFVNLLVGNGLAFIEGRPLVPLGYSRGGLYSHELSARLAARGFRIPLEVLIDTLFPGEERRRREIISLNRRSKYRAMVESRQFGRILKEVGKKAADRAGGQIRAITTSSTRSQSRADNAQRRFGLEAAPLTTADYSAPAVRNRGVVYRASGTLSAWTTDRWREVIPVVDEVIVEGRHEPPNCIMEEGRVDQIASDLVRRLSSLPA